MVSHYSMHHAAARPPVPVEPRRSPARSRLTAAARRHHPSPAAAHLCLAPTTSPATPSRTSPATTPPFASICTLSPLLGPLTFASIRPACRARMAATEREAPNGRASLDALPAPFVTVNRSSGLQILSPS